MVYFYGFHDFHVGKYTSPMDPMGYVKSCVLMSSWLDHPALAPWPPHTTMLNLNNAAAAELQLRQLHEKAAVFGKTQLSNEENPRILSIESWMVNRDPYFMVYYK